MTSITVQAQVDNQGRISLELPEACQGKTVMVMIQSLPFPNDVVLEETAGSISDLKCPPQVDPLWLQEQSWIQARIKSKPSDFGTRDWTREMLYDRYLDEEEA